VIDTWVITRRHRRTAASRHSRRRVSNYAAPSAVVCVSCGDGPRKRDAGPGQSGEADPPCERCGGILKSATVMFGQPSTARSCPAPFASPPPATPDDRGGQHATVCLPHPCAPSPPRVHRRTATTPYDELAASRREPSAPPSPASRHAAQPGQPQKWTPPGRPASGGADRNISLRTAGGYSAHAGTAPAVVVNALFHSPASPGAGSARTTGQDSACGHPDVEQVISNWTGPAPHARPGLVPEPNSPAAADVSYVTYPLTRMLNQVRDR
jgi:hypothetical protein